MSVNDGGPAFAQPLVCDAEGNVYCSGERNANHSGMTLRDYFAAHATAEDIEEHLRLFTREVAKYRYADAMLAAREKAGGAS